MSAAKASSSTTSTMAAQQEGAQAVEAVYQLSELLNTGLDRHSLSLLISLLESGVNPEALAAAVKEITLESKTINSSPTTTSAIDTSSTN